MAHTKRATGATDLDSNYRDQPIASFGALSISDQVLDVDYRQEIVNI